MNKSVKKLLISSLLVALASQVSFGLFDTTFKISGGVIAFFIILYIFDALDPLIAGLGAGVAVYLFRVLVEIFEGGTYLISFISYLPSFIYYIFYAILFWLFIRKYSIDNIFVQLPLLIIMDLSANLVEIYFRYLFNLFEVNWNILIVIILAAVLRSLIIILILKSLKYYRILVVKKEELKRYQKLMLLSSRLETESYWIKKNKEFIENVMSSAYKLHENIKNEEKVDTWDSKTLNIAKNIHEIKKGYNLILKELNKITEKSSKTGGLYLSELIEILKLNYDSFKLNCKLDFEIDLKKDFIVQNDYYLMSVLRNILNNALEAVSEIKNGEVVMIYKQSSNNHVFKIQDNGPGIQEKNKDLIFSPGFSTKINYETGEVNRGLGLSLARDIVDNIFGGKIIVKSKINEKTIFEVIIPCEKLEE
ncbi:MAG: ATP-binding protein [Halanaerobiales bacterium]